MKKRHLLSIATLVAVLLCCAGMALAQESTFFDGTLSGGRIIRTCESCTSCTAPTDTPPSCASSSCASYAIYIEVRNPTAAGGIDSSYNVACNGATPAAVPTGATTVVTATPSADVSLSYNSATYTAYVYTLDADEQPQLSTCTIIPPYTPPPTYDISGTVTNSSGGSGLSNVTVTLSGAASQTTTTNSSGGYSFSGLAGGSYTVTPSLSGYTSAPASWTGSVSANVTQNFVATPIPSTPVNLSVSIQGATAVTYGTTFSSKATVKNGGQTAAGSFTVSLWLTDTGVVDSNAQLLGTWTGSSLGAGQSVTHEFGPFSSTALSIHTSYWLVVTVSPSSNQTGSTAYWSLTCL